MIQQAATDTRIDAATLLDWMGYKRQAPCKRALEKQGIPVFEGRNGIWTTLELVNQAGLSNIGQSPVPPQEKEQDEWL